MTESFAPHRFTRPSNFRDLAEQAASELPMRRGVLFRSDHLGHLDEQDAKQIAALGLSRVLDFRGADERLEAVCALPGVTVHSLAIEPTVVQVLAQLMAAGQELTAEEVIGHMQDTYRDFVRHNTGRFAEFFGHLLASDEPTVFHCTAGKDRTGFAAALVLLALGASQEMVMRDYLLTNERFKPPLPRTRAWLSPQAGAVLWGVQPDFLHAALDTVQQDYGSMQAYLRDGLGLADTQMRRLRELYLRH